jgi:O-antigen/teichoic acid export membrane protein
MYLQDIIRTFLSKIIILILNFLIVILTTNLWGAEGRGMISILLANMSLIAIFNNVLGGSSIAYLTPRIGFSKLVLPAYIWVFIVSLIGASLFTTTLSHNRIFVLFVLTLLNSLLSLNLSVFIAKENLKSYNIYSVLLPVSLISCTLFLNYIVGLRSVNSYIYGYILALSLVFLFSWAKMRSYLVLNKIAFSWEAIQKSLAYGWKNEMSNFLQFLNYRLSYYFVLYYLGLKSVGVFSIGIAIAESIWVICRSISLVQYSTLINIDDKKLSIEITKKSAKISFMASSVVVLLLLVVPSDLYRHVFGLEFRIVKQLLIVLIPGILALSFSNVHGHFFAARNELNVLIVKSSIGLLFTVIFSFILIPRWGIVGASVVTSTAYLLSSAYLVSVFYLKLKD